MNKLLANPVYRLALSWVPVCPLATLALIFFCIMFLGSDERLYCNADICEKHVVVGERTTGWKKDTDGTCCEYYCCEEDGFAHEWSETERRDADAAPPPGVGKAPEGCKFFEPEFHEWDDPGKKTTKTDCMCSSQRRLQALRLDDFDYLDDDFDWQNMSPVAHLRFLPNNRGLRAGHTAHTSSSSSSNSGGSKMCGTVKVVGDHKKIDAVVWPYIVGFFGCGLMLSVLYGVGLSVFRVLWCIENQSVHRGGDIGATSE